MNVYTKAPSSWREWFKQRKRWGMGAALWLKENYRSLLRIVREYPKILLSLLLLFPSLLMAMSILIIPEEIYVKIAYILFFILSTRASILLPPTAFASTSLLMTKNILMTVSSLLRLLIAILHSCAEDEFPIQSAGIHILLSHLFSPMAHYGSCKHS